MDIFKKKRTLIIGALFIMLLSLFGLTYAFFNANVIGDGKDIVVVGGSLSLHFEDGSEMTIDDAYPGDKIEKIFTVTNTGTLPTSYTMWWKDLTNTFINDELVMSLECTSYKEIDGEKVVNGTCSGLNETVIGTDSSFPIKSNIQIESGIIHEYKLIILFKEMGIIQNYNMNKSFGGTINIKEYFHNETNIPVLESYDMTNKDLVAKVSDTGYIVEYAITDASVTSADDVTWTTIERTSVLDINQVIEDYDIKIWVKNNAGNIMCEDLTPQISLVVKPNGGTWNGSTGDQTYNFAYSQTLNIPNPTREGYTFNDWSLVGSESKLTGTTFTAGIENTTLTANWTINEYTLTVNPNGGKYNNSTSNTTYTLDYKESQNISIPEREGYTFTGWSISSNKAQLSTNVLTIGSENCTLTANWNVNSYEYTVKHNKMNISGSGYTTAESSTANANYGDVISPDVKTYAGFTSPSKKSITIGTGDNIVEYNYTRNQYTLTIDANGGTYSGNTSVQMYYEATTTISTPEREGYTFTGWSVSGGELTNSTTFKMSDAQHSSLTATWQVNNYPWIAYHNKMNVSGSGYTLVDADTASGSAGFGSKVTPELKTYTGFTSPSSKEITIVADSNPPTKNVVNYNYSRNKYNLTINPNGGTYNSSTSNSTVNMYYEAQTTLSTPDRTGYTFTGWSENAGTLNGNTFTMSEAKASTVTAGWSVNQYPYVVYHRQMNVDGNGYTVVAADTVSGNADYGSEITGTIKTYTGFTSPTTTQKIIIDVDTDEYNKNVITYDYTRNKYGLTIDANGGTYSGNNPGELYYEQTVTIANPTRTGYNFGGWTKSGGGSLSGTTFTGGTSATTLTASWNAITSTVTLNGNGATTNGSSSVTATYDGGVTTITVPTKTSYTLDGWYTAASGGTKVINADGTLVASVSGYTNASSKWIGLSNVTLYAHWQATNPIAQIGTNTYASLADAINAVPADNSKVIVTMAANSSSGATIPANKNVELALNSKTITGNITNNGTLTISGSGTVRNTTAASTSPVINNTNSLTISGGTYSTNSTSAALINNSKTLNMSSGTLTHTGSICVFNNTAGTLTVTGGSITGPCYITSSAGSTATHATASFTDNNMNAISSISGTQTFSSGSLSIIAKTGNDTTNIHEGEFTVQSGGQLNISGGTLTSSGTYVEDGGIWSIYVVSGGTLNYTGGTFNCNNGASCIRNYGTATISNLTLKCETTESELSYTCLTNWGNMSIKGSTKVTSNYRTLLGQRANTVTFEGSPQFLHNSGTGTIYALVTSQGGKITINSGTFSSSVDSPALLFAGGSADIYAGTFTTGYNYLVAVTGASDVVRVYGGTFQNNSSGHPTIYNAAGTFSASGATIRNNGGGRTYYK